MAITTKITAEAGATDKRMTLAELREFVAACDGAPDDSWLDVSTKGLGKLRKIELIPRLNAS